MTADERGGAANTTTDFAKSYEQPRRLGIEPATPFIGKAKPIQIFRARSVAAKRGNTSEVVWWVLFEIGTEGAWGNVPLYASNTEAFKQLQAVIGFSPADLGIDAKYEFKLRPEIHVSDGNPYWKLHQICPPSPAEMIKALKAHADHVGALTGKHGMHVDQIIREHINQAQIPDFNGAWKAIADLTTPIEKANKATEIIQAQAAAGKKATEDSHYASASTQEEQDKVMAALQKEWPDKFPQPDELIDGLKVAGAVEVSVQQTDPLPSDGTSTMPKEDLKRDEYGNSVKEHSTTDPDKMCFAIPKYLKRELSLADKDVSKHVKALFQTDIIPASVIRERGTAATWREVEQYVARFKTQEEDLATKTKPAATDEKPPEEVAAPVRPTTEEIDAARKRISEMGIKTAEDFKAATGYDNIPAAIQAGEPLKTIENSAWMWAIENDKKQPAENSAKEAISAPSGDAAPTTQQKQNTHQEGEMSNSEQTIVSRDEKVKEIREKFNKPQRGNDYLTVQGRIALFRLKNPSGSIDTEHVILTEDTAVFRAKIVIDGAIVASGYGRATEAGTKNLGGRYVEKAETAAIGRALAVAGYGTDDSLDDADYLSDSPIERKAA